MLIKNILILIILFPCNLYAQDDSSLTQKEPILLTKEAGKEKPAGKIYHINPAIDWSVSIAAGGWSVYSMTRIYNKPPASEQEIINLNKNNVPSYDRGEAGVYNRTMDKNSYYPFYGVMPLPLLLLLDKKIAKDKGDIGLLYLESFAFEGLFYTTSLWLVDRYRPEAYNTNLPLSTRTNGNLRNSFFAGHVAVMANSTFFISKIYDDYHPHSNFKWVLYGVSAAATLGMSYMRLEAGQHFPSDIITGIVVGTACGLLTPQLHKKRDFKEQKWSMLPSFDNGTGGFAFVYRF